MLCDQIGTDSRMLYTLISTHKYLSEEWIYFETGSGKGEKYTIHRNGAGSLVNS